MHARVCVHVWMHALGLGMYFVLPNSFELKCVCAQEATLRQALALDPTSQQTALYLAGVLADKGLVQETAQMLERACKGAPEGITLNSQPGIRNLTLPAQAHYPLVPIRAKYSLCQT